MDTMAERKIHRYFSVFLRKDSLVILLLLSLHLFLSQRLLLVDPPIHPDETFFADTAKSIAETGISRLSIRGEYGLSRLHIRNYSYPPLYTDALSIWFQIFGSTITSMRLFSVLLSCFCIVSFYVVLRKISGSLFITVLTTLLFYFFGPFGLASRVGRMEILILFFSLAAYGILFLTRLTYRDLFLLGMLCGLSVLTHPIGGIVVISAGIVLLFKRKSITPRLLLTGILPFLGCLLYWMLRYSDSISLFIEQLQLQFSYKQNRIPIVDQLFEQQMHWRYTLLFLFGGSTIGILWGYVKQKSNLILTGILTLTTYLIVWKGIEQWYIVLLFVPFLLLTGFLYKNSNTSGKVLTVVCILCLLAIHVASFRTFILTNTATNQSYSKFTHALSSSIPKDAKILVSAFPDPTFGLWEQGYKTVHGIEHMSTPGVIAELLATYDVIIINYVTNAELRELFQTKQYENTVTVDAGSYSASIVYLK